MDASAAFCESVVGTVGPPEPGAVGAIATRRSGGTPASRAMIDFTGVLTMRLASRLARALSVSAPFGLRSTTCEAGVSMSVRAEAMPTWYCRLSSFSDGSETR